MKIGFIGAGRVGCSLGKYITKANSSLTLAGYYSKSMASARDAAAFTDSVCFEGLGELASACDVISITTPDDKISNVWQSLRNQVAAGKIVLHCSGAMSSAIFDGADELGVTVASLHPLYAISDRYTSYLKLSEALFTIEGSGTHFEKLREAFADCGLSLQDISADAKTTYHAAASVASNLMIGLVELSVEQLEACGFERERALEALAPLMRGNLDAALTMDTTAALTGPAERADERTVQKHLDVLSGEDKEIYRLLTKKLLTIAKRKNPKRDYTVLEELIR